MGGWGCEWVIANSAEQQLTEAEKTRVGERGIDGGGGGGKEKLTDNIVHVTVHPGEKVGVQKLKWPLYYEYHHTQIAADMYDPYRKLIRCWPVQVQ